MALSDYLPDFTDPNQMAAWGALGGVLQAGAQPRYDPMGRGITGGSAGNALALLAAAGMGGAVGGAQGAQQFQKENIGNQVGQLGLEKAQALQPFQINMIKNAMSGSQMPGSLAGSSSGAQQPAIGVADQQFAQAYQLALASGNMGKASAVLQSWAEHNPQLAGEIERQKALKGITQSPNGPVWGSMVPGGGASASPPSPGMPGPPQGGTQPPITPVQGPVAIPPVNASQLQPPPSPAQIPANPFVVPSIVSPAPAFNPMSKVSTESAVKNATDNAANRAEAEKTYDVMISNFPNMQQRIGDMSDANKKSSFGPFVNDPEGNGFVTSLQDSKLGDPATAAANAVLQQRAAQGVLPELGPSLAQAGIKGNKFLETLANSANNIDLSKGTVGRQTQIDGLMKAYIQNMKSQHDQIAGLGGTPSPLPPHVVAQAAKYGVMTKDEAVKYLQTNHGMQ